MTWHKIWVTIEGPLEIAALVIWIVLLVGYVVLTHP